MHLVGSIIGIYHDERSPEDQRLTPIRCHIESVEDEVGKVTYM